MKVLRYRPAMCFALLLLVACAAARNGPVPPGASVGDQIGDFFTLPLAQGPGGFDQLANALQRRFPTDSNASAIEQTAQQTPITLQDGYVVQRYLRLQDGRHLMAEFAKTPCVPVQLAVSLTRPDPVQLDHYRRTGIYLAAGRGMSVTFSADAAKPECVAAVEIAETPGKRTIDTNSSRQAFARGITSL
ncbi:hypothetical protein [Lysobacter sp. ESA13C]|uniref:hypothetical protein n=1 Tax=Lysobacter sp. ESA13C TaxID=2862676 RepID=UPI001CBCD256|nr:hypothetical protein [Lysobacter sp. ESA13C]